MKNTTLLCIMGPTNVGKTYMLNYAKNTYDSCHIISVGKILRKKYHPSVFKGKQAPSNMTEEAKKLMVDGIIEGINRNKKLILVDGQPREMPQIEAIFDNFINGKYSNQLYVHFVILHCDDEVRMQRLMKRDKDPSLLELSKKRFKNDVKEIEKLLDEIKNRDCEDLIVTLDTTENQEQNFDDLYKMLEFHHYKLENC